MIFCLPKKADPIYSQFQKRPVSVAVAELLLALLAKVSFQGTDSLRVVPLEAVDNGGDVIGPLGGVFAVHFCGVAVSDTGV